MVALTHVLCPVDLSELSIPALAWAGNIADWCESQLLVLHVAPTFEPMEVRPAALFDAIQSVNPMTQEQVEERLRDASATLGSTTEQRGLCQRKGPSSVLSSYAESIAGGRNLSLLATILEPSHLVATGTTRSSDLRRRFS
jgi:hypothetical protein